MDEHGFGTTVDNHRICVSCEQLERATWPHPYAPPPWLCPHCVAFARTCPDVARTLRGQLAYQASELVTQGSAALVHAAMTYLIEVWEDTEGGHRARADRFADEAPW